MIQGREYHDKQNQQASVEIFQFYELQISLNLRTVSNKSIKKLSK
jgi:hypothetical protein